MHRSDPSRRMPAIALFVVMFCEPLVICAQRDLRGVPTAADTETQGTTPDFHPTHEQIGDALLAHQRFQEAIAEYKQAPQNSADVWNKMGIAYQLMSDPKDAEHCYQEAFRRNPKNAHVVNNLATIYDSEKEYRKAEHLYRKSLKLDPNSALVTKNLGTNLMTRHKYKEGWAEYKRALELDPRIFDERGASLVENTASLQDRGAMNYYMAKGCVQAGLTDRAIQYLRLAMSEGYLSPKKVAEDSSFSALHGNPTFQKLMAEQREQ
ncbi:MAG TPA: tetratricopeptide repeat protein [Terracidiphilus sp.]|nr:tetratricopeptide repeat protein [Terracidiphilus sp.]